MSSSLTIIFIGRPGSGKSTQIEKLKERFNFKVVTTGGLMRDLAKQDSFVGKKLKKVLDDGGLPPEWLAVHLWINELLKLKPSDKLILDGSPRRLMEAKKLDSVLKWLGRNNVKLFLVDISEEESMRRVAKRRICDKCGVSVIISSETKDQLACKKCGGKLITRGDDDESDVKAKFAWFNSNVKKVIKHYKKIGELVVINGERSITDVYKDIENHLK